MSAISDIDPRLLRSLPLPSLPRDGDKEDRGRVLVVGGGRAVPGAALLTGTAALRAGAGKLQLSATEAYVTALGVAIPEARIIPTPAAGTGEIGEDVSPELLVAASRSDAVVIGPGMIDETVARRLVDRLLPSSDTAIWVIDAAAMTGLRDFGRFAVKGAAGRLVVTPHAGEMASLLGRSKSEVLDDLVGAARQVAGELQAVVVMKSRETFVVAPDGQAWRNREGVPGLGTSGSGDVLAGVIGGLAARGASASVAAVWGVWLHARAGARLAARIGSLGFLARELPAEIPGALDEVDDKASQAVTQAS